MRLALFFITLFGLNGCAQVMDAREVFDRYLWRKRVIIVFSPQGTHPDYERQIEILQSDIEGLEERDIVRWVIIKDTIVTGEGKVLPQFGTGPFYREFEVERDVFAVLLIGKDGEIKMREGRPVSLETLYGVIDSMPMRQREMQEYSESD